MNHNALRTQHHAGHDADTGFAPRVALDQYLLIHTRVVGCAII
jgi:hypothetical protein